MSVNLEVLPAYQSTLLPEALEQQYAWQPETPADGAAQTALEQLASAVDEAVPFALEQQFANRTEMKQFGGKDDFGGHTVDV